ncbi:MAG TPA: choice-of-anchor R domain-containing protein [Terriglobales bacterium]
MRKSNQTLVVAILILALASLVSSAAAQQNATLRDGKTIVPHNPSGDRPAAAEKNASSPVAIFSNIGTAYPKATYWCCEGSIISGPGSPGGFEWWDGAAFTPTANATVTSIGLALGYISGTNQVQVHLNQDANGVPGPALRTWTVQNIPGAGTCCIVTHVYDETGIPVTANVQYWVSVTTNGNDEDIQAVWDVDDTNEIDPAPNAARCQGSLCRGNGKWAPFQGTPGLAFEVSGK